METITQAHQVNNWATHFTRDDFERTQQSLEAPNIILPEMLGKGHWQIFARAWLDSLVMWVNACTKYSRPESNPLFISSGFRTMELNEKIGGSAKSLHLGWYDLEGLSIPACAVDLQWRHENNTLDQICDMHGIMKYLLTWDQLITEHRTYKAAHNKELHIYWVHAGAFPLHPHLHRNKSFCF